MHETKNINEKTVFAFLPEGVKDDPTPIMIVGIPADAWLNLVDGNMTSFDLTKVGFPCKLALFGAPTYDAAMKALEALASVNETAILDERRRDFSIDSDKKIS